MTIATVKTVATRFLISEHPGVLALKGAWGVGKTFAWNKLVQQHKEEIKPVNYCYVSLFGISSIHELRTTIFTKTQSVSLLDQKLDAKTINNQWSGILLEQGKKVFQFSSKIINELPYGKNISIGLETLAPHLIRNTIICLDDFERMNSDRIKTDELLGFISELKEEKNCKIVLIFNEDELGTNDTYKKYREKVVDIELMFAPTAEEAAELAFLSSLPCRETVIKYSVSLGIKNIRILRKIASLIEMIHVKIDTFHAGVMDQAVMSLVLLVWCYYDSDKKKPALEFINEWNNIVWVMNEHNPEKNKPEHASWAKILRDYGLIHMDEFDRTLCKVIECGYLEDTGFYEEATKLDSQIRANELEQTYMSAWKLYRNTFSDNKIEFIQALTEGFKKSVHHISPMNMNTSIVVLRQLDRGDIADELIEYYIDERANEVELFNLENGFPDDITDPAIVEAFNKKYTENHTTLALIDAVKHLAMNKGYSKEHTDALKSATEEDFYNLFKLEHGDALNVVVKTCLRIYDDTASAQKARTALVRIGKENVLNAIRIRGYGIAID